jgi:hypothetical protein
VEPVQQVGLTHCRSPQWLSASLRLLSLLYRIFHTFPWIYPGNHYLFGLSISMSLCAAFLWLRAWCLAACIGSPASTAHLYLRSRCEPWLLQRCVMWCGWVDNVAIMLCYPAASSNLNSSLPVHSPPSTLCSLTLVVLSPLVMCLCVRSVTHIFSCPTCTELYL